MIGRRFDVREEYAAIWRRALSDGLILYALTSLVSIVSGCWGERTIDLRPAVRADSPPRAWGANWDGVWYVEVAESGYRYQPGVPSNLAFFPAHPLLGRFLARATGIRTDLALLIVANAALAASFVLFSAYVRFRYLDQRDEFRDVALLAFGFLPVGFFLHTAYSEALFVFLLLLAMMGVLRRWPLLLVAFIVGAATGTRPTGMALVPVFAWRLWRDRYDDNRDAGRNRSVRGRVNWLARTSILLAIACWGILAFMAFQWMEWGDPLAFAKAQLEWRIRRGPDLGWPDKLEAMLAWEPIWGVYVPSNAAYWARYDKLNHALTSLQFANPIYFVATVLLVVVGSRLRLLNDDERLLSALLLIVPYATRSYDNAMGSFGRFCAVVIPLYPVLAALLMKLPRHARYAILAAMAALFALYTAMFAGGFLLI